MNRAVGFFVDAVSDNSNASGGLFYMLAKWLMIAGVLLLFIGAALQFAPWLVNWFGRLPGDIRIESGNSRVYIPITSMIVLSLVLTIIINLFKR